MTAVATPGPVVVGVDGSPAALDALDWAAAEAAARHSPLRVVHVVTWPAVVDPSGVVAAASYHACLIAADEVLDEAVSRARLVAPESRVIPRLVTGPAGCALLEQSLDAGLLVLGHRCGRMRRLVTWSVNAKVVAHATCPVAVVSPFRTVPPGPSAARVVVGVDGPTQSSAAIGYAYRAAAQRGIGLTALHAWNPAGPSTSTGRSTMSVPPRRTSVGCSTGPWRDGSGGSPLSRSKPDWCGVARTRALITESAGAALTVVGCRIRKGLRGVLVGKDESDANPIRLWPRCHDPANVVMSGRRLMELRPSRVQTSPPTWRFITSIPALLTAGPNGEDDPHAQDVAGSPRPPPAGTGR